MFNGRKAKRLGFQDLGRVSTRIKRNYRIHQVCGSQFRMGRTENNKIVYWCPKCEQVVSQKDGIPIENLEVGLSLKEKKKNCWLIEVLISVSVMCAFVFIVVMITILIAVKIKGIFG